MTALGASDGKKFARNLHQTQLGKNVNFIGVERDSFPKTAKRKNNKCIFRKFDEYIFCIVFDKQ